MLKKINFILSVYMFCGWLQGAMAASQIQVHTQLSPDRKTYQVFLINKQNQNMFCDKIDHTVQLRDRNYGEPVGEIRVSNVQTYLPSFHTVTLSDPSYVTENESQLIHNIKIETTTCRPAEFSDYCAFAPLSREEITTLEVIFQRLNVATCLQLNTNQISNLDLSRTDIENIKPLEYFTNLHELDLSRSHVSQIETLSQLKRLKKINLNWTMVDDITPLFDLPFIETLRARGTKVKSLPIHTPTTLRQLDVRDTPYEETFSQR